MNYTAASAAAPDDNVFYDSKREREGKGKLHTTADLGHADFHMQQDQCLGWESKFYYFAVVDETACQRGETAIQELIVYSNSQAQTGICFLFSSSTLS